MKYSIVWASIIFVCLMNSCNQSSNKPPNAGPVSALREDVYIYPWGKFYASSGDDEVHLGFLNPNPNVPILWVRGKPIDINKTRNSNDLIQVLGVPDGEYKSLSANHLTYGNNKSVSPTTAADFYIEAGNIYLTAIESDAGISLNKDSEVLTVPFSRKDLIRVFGFPKEFIKSQ